ncbi:MAG: transposase [Crocinitomicaceae bacterium]|nr:transposase [Crocinitomicaceae bacterium]
MQCFFGKIKNGEIQLSPEGEIAEAIWKMIPEKFPNIQIYEFIIMPNHLHGLIGFGIPNPKNERGSINCTVAINCTDAINRVSTGKGEEGAEMEDGSIIYGGATGAHNPMNHFSLSTIIRWFKGRSSFEIRKINPDFKWHGRYHDSIIKSWTQFENTVNYIQNNPLEWERDK